MNATEDKKVTVKAGKSGKLIEISLNNPEYGHIRLAQVRMGIDEMTGFARLTPISALVPGKIKDLEQWEWNIGDKISGKLIVKEQLTPFNPKEPDRDLKIAGKTGVVCTLGDKPIYRKSFYSLDENANDTLLAHDNYEEILAAFQEMKKKEEEEKENKGSAKTTAGVGDL